MSLQTARKVITAEIAGLTALMDDLGPDFEAAVETLMTAHAHIIVTGVGKSGHIGAKIASSLTSTGTPSFFMHAGEASHGDLGMLAPGCVILALSKSGETGELRDVLAAAKRQDIPIIAITRPGDTTLTRSADLVLALPDVPEAGQGAFVPTTSTTCMLALGDALTLTVMERRGFSTEEFQKHHPGGSLGLQLQKVADWLEINRPKCPLVGETADARQVIEGIASGELGCVGVTDAEGVLVGIITDGDLRRAMSGDFLSQTAADIMSPSPRNVTGDMRIGDVLALFAEHRISNAFIVENTKPIGVIHLKDLLGGHYV